MNYRKQLNDSILNSIKTSTKLSLKDSANSVSTLTSAIFSHDNIATLNTLNVLVTTSRSPSSFLERSAKLFAHTVGLNYLSRKNQTVKEIQTKDVIILTETKGRLSSIIIAIREYPLIYMSVEASWMEKSEGKCSPNINLILHLDSNIDINNNIDNTMLDSNTNTNLDSNNKNMNIENNLFSQIFKRLYTTKPLRKNNTLCLIKNNKLFCLRVVDKNLNVKLKMDLKLFKIVNGDIENHGEVLYVSREFVNTNF